jgi:branched-chain amino acid transport system substrate-binding protein
MRKLLTVLASVSILAPFSCHSRPGRVAIGIALTVDNHAAVELAAKEINDSGGIQGVPIVLLGLDWKVVTDFKSEDIIKWSTEFADTPDLVAVIGHSDSSSTLSAAAFYNQQRVPQLVTIATNPAITNIGNWTYRLCLSDAIQGVELADYAVRDWGKKSICVFYVNDAYGKGLSEVFQDEVRKLGARIVASRPHRNVLTDEDKQMIDATLANLKKSEAPDLVVLFQRMAAADWTISAIRQSGFHSDILGGDNLGQIRFLGMTPLNKDGIRVSEFYFPSTDDRAAMKFANSIRETTGLEADYGLAFAYDAVYLIRDAVAKYGFSRDAVKKYLDELIARRTVIDGAGGNYMLAPDHDARRTMYIVEARGGRYEQLKALTP